MLRDPSLSDLVFRPPQTPPRRRGEQSSGDAWEAVVREELRNVRRRSEGQPRSVPATRGVPPPPESR